MLPAFAQINRQELAEIGLDLRSRSDKSIAAGHVLGNFSTVADLAGFAGVTSGCAAGNFSTIFGWLGSPCHSRSLQGRRHDEISFILRWQLGKS